MTPPQSTLTWPRVLAVGLAVATIVSCGPTGMEMLGDAMVDAGTRLRDSGEAIVPDAHAQTCAISCSTGGTQRIMTADTDPAQLINGYASGIGGQTLVEGSLVLTDVSSTGGVYDVYTVEGDADVCGRASNFEVDSRQITYTSEPRSGLHVFVPAGEQLCARRTSTGTLRWSGFRPYD